MNSDYPSATFRLRHFFSYYTDPFPEIQPVEFEAFRSYLAVSRHFFEDLAVSRQSRYFQFKCGNF